MKKRSPKRLTLKRETVVPLVAGEIAAVQGAIQGTLTLEGSCDSACSCYPTWNTFQCVA